MLWLKWCIVPTFSHEVIVTDVVYPAVLLAFGRNIALLPVTVGCIQSGLRVLTKTFYKVEALVDEEGNMLIDWNDSPKLKVPDPIVELPYTYLVAWYVMHCPSLMMAVQASEDFVPFLQKLERSNCNIYMFFIRRTNQSDVNYQPVWCFSDIQDTSYRDRFLNITSPDGFTTLSTDVFCWLTNIRLGYLVFR